MFRTILSIFIFVAIFITFLLVTQIFIIPAAFGTLLPIGLASHIESLGYARESIYYLKSHDIYTTLGWIVLSLSAAAAVTLIIMENRVNRFLKLVLIVAPLLLAIPLSAINYAYADAFSTRSVQALINIPIVFLSILSAVALAQSPSQSKTGEIAKLVILGLIVMQGISIPALYSILWWLNFQNAITLAASKSFNPGWISAVSGAVGVGISVYKHFDDRKKFALKAASETGWKPFRPRDKA